VYTVLWNPYHSVQIKYAGKKTSTTTENASDPNTQTAVVYKKIPLTFSEQDISFFADDMIYQLADNPNLLHDMSTLDDLDLAGDSRLAPLDEILLAARNKQIAGEKLNTRELLEYLTREVITKLNVVYGFAKFDGDSLSQVPITEKLAKLMEHEPGKPLIWDCDQFAYVVKTLARSLSLDVHLDIGYLQSSLNNQGGHAQSGHMWIIYRQDGDPNWHLFEPTSYMPVTALIFNQTEYPTLLESLEAEEVNQKIKFSIFISLVGAVVVGGVTVNSRKIYKSIRQFSKDRSAQRLENTVADHEQEFLNAVSTFEQALMQSHSQSVHAVWAMLRSVLGVADVRLSSGKLETASGWYTLRGVIPVVQPNGEVALKSGELEPSEENAQLLAEEFLLTAINTDRHNDQLAPQTSEKLLVIINDLQRSGRDIIKRRQFSNAIFRKLFYNFFKDNFDEKRSKLYQGLQLVTSAIETELKSNPEKYLLQDNQAAADRVHQALDLLRQCKTLFEFDYRQL
jgi:hypothetical protein